jgi:ABC-type nitrate/sulfonate/bicarbonate transport system permease component
MSPVADEIQTATPAVAAGPRTGAPRRRSARPLLRRATRLLVPIGATLGFVALLQLVTALGVISQDAIPLPTDIIGAFVEALGTSEFWAALRSTLEGWAIGLGLACLAGITLGIAAGTSTAAFRSLRFLVDFFRPIPSIAILPVLILLLGIEMQVKITLAALAAFFPLFFATLYGVQDLDPVARDTATVYRVPRRLRLLLVSLPGSTPYIATGLRISASVALLLTVGTEMVVGLPGIGREIFDAQYAGDLPGMYALVAASGVLGILIAACFRLMEKRVLRWHPSQTKELV